MPRVAFTKRVLDTLPVPPSGRAYYHDTRTPHLSLAITPAGGKSFVWYGRIKGRPVRILLGKYPDITPDLARTQAVKLSGQIAGGGDPQETKRAAREEATLRDLYDTYMDAHSRPHKKSSKDDEGLWRRYLQPWAGRRLSTIRQADVQGLHRRIGQEHPGAGNRLLALVSVMYNKFGRQFGCADNPCHGIKRYRENSRDRFMDGDELRRFFDALRQEPDPWPDFFMLALLTGARRSNLQRMEWTGLDLMMGTWHVPGEQSKNARPLMLVLVPAAVALLRTRRERLADSPSPYVFASWGKYGYVTEPKKAWHRVCRRADLKDLRLHDCRRTFGSWQACLGTSLAIIGGSLGHQSQLSTAIYARLQLSPIRQSVEQATAAMLQAGRRLPGPVGEQLAGQETDDAT